MLQRPTNCKINSAPSHKHRRLFTVPSVMILAGMMLAIALFATPLFARDSITQQPQDAFGRNGTIPPAPTFELTVNTEGDGSVAPASGRYAAGTMVELVPMAAPGWQFQGWRGAFNGHEGSATLMMDADKVITATFVQISPERVALTTHTEGNGSGIIHLSPASRLYDSGTIVTITVTADPGSIFVGWGGACSGTQIACFVTMDEAKLVTATFVLEPSQPLGRYTLTTATSGTGSGTVTLDPAGGSYAIGTTVTATAVTALGSTFVGWGGDCIGLQICTLTIERSQKVEAIFRAEDGAPTEHPTAIDDEGSTSRGKPIVIDLVANDRPAATDGRTYEESRAGLAIDAVSQPSSTGSPISGVVTLEGTQATFQPGPEFIGTAHFTYLLSDRQKSGEGAIDIGEVTITVVKEMTIIPVQNGERATHSFDGTISVGAGPSQQQSASQQQGSSQSYTLQTLVDIPAGAMLNYPGAAQSLELSFGWLDHATISDQQQRALPDGIIGEPIHFVIDATIDGLLSQEYAFGNPIKAAIAYPEELFGDMGESTLAVRYWDTRAKLWQNDGVHIIQHDRGQNLVVIEIGHLTHFALFAQGTAAPSFGEDGGPPVSPQPALYLPLVR